MRLGEVPLSAKQREALIRRIDEVAIAYAARQSDRLPDAAGIADALIEAGWICPPPEQP